MARLSITLACGAYDRTRALLEGRVRADGVDLNVLPLSNAWARHQRMLTHEEFDACELSTSSFLLARDRDQGFVGLPVFPYRMFRHSYVWCNASAGIKTPKGLRGKRIGVGMYQITTAIWVRGFLQHDYGVRAEDLVWCTELPELVPLRGDMRAKIERLPVGRSGEELLLAGELDAYIAVEGTPPAFRGNAHVHRLFPDYRAVETDYFRRTGFFPIMHTLVVREPLLKSHPWLAVSLMEAFRASKREGMAEGRFPRASSLAWYSKYQDEEREVLGQDPYPYSWPDNRETMNAICAYSYEQGMVSRRFAAEELFAPSSLDYPEQGSQEGGRIQRDV